MAEQKVDIASYVAKPVPPEWVLVRGVVYHRVVRFHGSRGREQRYYLRLSVPPDATPGKRSKWPVRYDEGRLPEHEVIDKQRAEPIQKESAERFISTLRKAQTDG